MSAGTGKKYNISVEATLEVIGGKWKCVILCHLTHGKKADERSEAYYAQHYAKDVNPAAPGTGGGWDR